MSVKVMIDKFDDDYCTWVGVAQKTFATEADAHKWCAEASKGGYTYAVDRKSTEKMRDETLF